MTRFCFKKFQLEDIARAALLDGLPFTWEPGMGKTLAGIAWPIIKQARRVLLVVPGQLHRDFRREAHRFRIHITSLTHHRQLASFGIQKPLPTPPHPTKNGSARPRQPRFFITTYHELGYNHTSGGRPSMADHIAKLIDAGAGFDCVVADEVTRLQGGDETHIAAGVLKLNPPMRLALTGTPAKNRLESFHFLACWAAGENWPYEATRKGRDEFAREHLMTVRSKGQTERTARLTNIHHLWRITAPIVVRRCKIDCGEDIPPKIVKDIALQPGSIQSIVYANHLFYPPLISAAGRPVNGFGRVAMQLNYLRQAALAPHSPSLGIVQSAAEGIKKSSTDFNPKMATCLSLVAKVIRTGQQIIIGSPFRAFSHSLHARLRQAKVSSLLLDGQTPPLVRGKLAEHFKSGRYAVLVVGIAAMGEGFDFSNCSHLILPALSWAYDENEQFVNRIWRITSKKPVRIYTLSIAGTIDERLAQLYAEKSASAQLAFDYRLIDNDVEDVDLGELLKHSIKAFNPAAVTLDETAMQHQWHAKLRNQLTRAEAVYRRKHPLSPISVKQNFPKPLPTPPNPRANTEKKSEVDWRAISRILKQALAA